MSPFTDPPDDLDRVRRGIRLRSSAKAIKIYGERWRAQSRKPGPEEGGPILPARHGEVPTRLPTNESNEVGRAAPPATRRSDVRPSEPAKGQAGVNRT